MSQTKPQIKNRLYYAVLNVLQDLEEIGGTESAEEYIEVMEAIRDEVDSRILNAKTNPDS